MEPGPRRTSSRESRPPILFPSVSVGSERSRCDERKRSRTSRSRSRSRLPKGMFTVEKILRKKICKIGDDDVEMYLIKWEGYPSTTNTWEPEENLSTAMVEDFNARNTTIEDDNIPEKMARIDDGSSDGMPLLEIQSKNVDESIGKIDERPSAESSPDTSLISSLIGDAKIPEGLTITETTKQLLKDEHFITINDTDSNDRDIIPITYDVCPSLAVAPSDQKSKEHPTEDAEDDSDLSVVFEKIVPHKITEGLSRKAALGFEDIHEEDNDLTGRELEFIFNAIEKPGLGKKTYYFIVKFKNIEDLRYVSAEVLNKAYPSHVISFWESRGRFSGYHPCVRNLSGSGQPECITLED